MSDDARFQRVKEIFLAAVEAPIGERARVVADAAAGDPVLVADVMALLDHHGSPSPYLREPAGLESDPKNDGLPLAMGRYVLERLLGEGATGRVFAATQRNPRRPVAVKLLRPGLQAEGRGTERFLREAEVLAKLDHPGIARVYESGIAMLAWGPQAFIAMERIEGQPLTQFALQRGLDLAAKLTLLAKVCDAVEYSHAHGVVHRDLKPSNVLVQEDGQPRVLDFGVAHAMHDDAGTPTISSSDLVGTLAYMSPERADRRDPGGVHSDVYSLGVIAYELIAGSLPVVAREAGIWDAMRAVRERRFESLRESVPACGLDLELVVGKALRSEPSDRYQSAAAFAADLRRVIECRPVSVRKPTALYRLSRLMLRTPRRVIVGGVVIATAVAGGVLSAGQWILARQKLQEMRLTREYDSMLPRHRPGVTPADATAAALADMSRRASAELASHPVVEADLQYRIGMEYYAMLGRYADAERKLLRARKLTASKGARDPLVEDVAIGLALLWAWRDNTHEAEEKMRRIVRELERGGDDPARLSFARRQLAWRLSLKGRSDELDAQLVAIEKESNNESASVAAFEVRCIRASALHYAGDAAQAEQLLPPIEEIKRLLRGEPWETAYRGAGHLAAFIQLNFGRIDTAEEILRLVLEATVSEQGSTSYEAIVTRNRLAGILWLKKDYGAAEREFAEIAALTAPGELNDPVLQSTALNNRAVCLRDLGRLAEAEATLNEALAIRRTTGGPESVVVSDTLLNLASVHLRAGRGAQALACAQESARIRRLRGQWIPSRESETRAMIGRAQMMVDGPAAGLAELERAWQIRWDSKLLTNWQTNAAVDGLLEALLALGRGDDARRVAEQELAAIRESVGPDNEATRRATERCAMVAERLAAHTK